MESLGALSDNMFNVGQKSRQESRQELMKVFLTLSISLGPNPTIA